MVVTPQSIAAAALLSHSERGMTLRAIQERSSLYLNWLFSKHVQLSQAIIADPETAVEIALDQLVLNKIITKHEEALEPFYSVDEDKRLELDYFKNGCIHFLASISVLSTLLLKYAATETPFAAEEFLNDFKGCQNLLKYEFRFSARGSIIEHIQKIAHYLELKGALTTTTGNTYILSSKADSILVPFSNLLRNFFESIKIALAAMKNASYEKVDDKELVKTMLQTGKNLLLLGDIRLKESISKENFSNALRLLCHYGILRDHSAELGTKGAKIFSTTGNQQAYNNLKVQLERLI
jgi:glycerol-3-phosphate O-acyltransferase